MLKKFLSALVAVTLALGTVALTATPANAGRDDDPTISVSADISCTKDLTYEITWLIENDSDRTATVTSTSNASVVPLRTTIPAKGFITGTEIVSSAQSRSLSIKTSFSGGGSAEDSDSVRSSDFPKCEPPAAKVSLCHASPPDTAAQGWNSQSVDDSSVIDGAHDTEHDADIIPSFTYWEQVSGVWKQMTYPGKNLTTTFSGFTGAQILASNCTQAVTATAPTLTPSVCTAPGVVGAASYTIPTTSGVTYQVRVGAGSFATKAAGNYSVTVPSTITIRAVASPSWVTLSGTTEWSLAYTSPGDCIVTVAPVAPTVTTITACGTSGSIVFATTTGVTYTRTQGNGLEGAWQVTATAQSGYRLTGQTVFSGNLGTRTTCATPVAPSFTAAVCTGPGTNSDGSYVIPSTTGVTYRVSINGGAATDVASGTQFVFTFPTTVTVTAVAQSGYTLAGSTGPWSSTFADPGACLRVSAPVSPTASPITECGSEGDLVLPTTPGVVYTLTLGDGKSGPWEVTATPAAGYRFDGDQSVVSRGDLGEYTDCVTPAAPTFVQAVCTGPGESGPGSYVIPNTPGVIYWVSIDGATPVATPAGTHEVTVLPAAVEITATADAGFTLEDYPGPWVETLIAAGDCLVEVTPVAPSATAITECGTSGEVLLPKTEGVIYTITSGSGLSGLYEVTATAATGYAIKTGAQTVFPLDLGEYTDCVTPAAPTFEQAVCTDPGENSGSTYRVPTAVGVVYLVSVDGSVPTVTAAGTYDVPAATGTHTVQVTARADSGYTLTGATGPWSFVFGDPGDCLVEVVPASAAFIDSQCPMVVGDAVSSGTVTIPSTPGVEYWVSVNSAASVIYPAGDHPVAAGDGVVVDAAAATGYRVSNGTSTWSHTFAECEPPTLNELLPAVSVTAATCTALGSIVVDEAEHLLYRIDGVAVTQASTPKAPGTYTVTAASDDPISHTILDNQPFVVTVTGPTACFDLTTLALTGAGGSWWLAGSAALSLLTIGAILLVTRRRENPA